MVNEDIIVVLRHFQKLLLVKVLKDGSCAGY